MLKYVYSSKGDLMHFSRLYLLPIIAGLTFPSCQKEESAGAVAEAVTPIETCPNLTAQVAHLGMDQQPQTSLLTHFTAAQIADLRANTCLTMDLTKANYAAAPLTGDDGH